VFSHAFLIQLEPALELPKVKAGSDAQQDSAEWVPFADLDPREFFEDHYFLIKKMLSRMRP
jgi:bifunctional NMN adenylyltransferase/nudix hydrolase